MLSMPQVLEQSLFLFKEPASCKYHGLFFAITCLGTPLLGKKTFKQQRKLHPSSSLRRRRRRDLDPEEPPCPRRRPSSPEEPSEEGPLGCSHAVEDVQDGGKDGPKRK